MAGERPQRVRIDADAVDHLIAYCETHGFVRPLLVMDPNTRAAQGERTEVALRAAGIDATSVLLDGGEVVADAERIFQVLLAADPLPDVYVAIGSGTITDITRFVSHRSGRSFISMPTAPSVDGFASIGAPLIIDGVKETVICHAPVAIFADVNTLASAPRPLIAAGFGDMLGKLTSIADWRLGRLLWDEPYDEEIAQRTLHAVQFCIDHVEAIGDGSPAGARALLEGLIESGYCMLDFGSSRPASGAEHHYSHYWEMKLLREGRPAILHGAKVGVATILVADFYEQVRNLARADLSDRLEAATLPAHDEEVARIEAAYGREAEGVIRAHGAFLTMNAEAFDDLKQRILDNWDVIREIAAQVPAPEIIAGYLRQAGAPTTTAELGLSAEERALAEANGHYLRDRFTVRKLMRIIGEG